MKYLLFLSIFLINCSFAQNNNNQISVASIAFNKATANLSSTCQISADNVNFGDITQKTQNPQIISVVNSFHVLCSNSLNYTIKINMGTNVADYYSYGIGRLLKGSKYSQTLVYWICSTPTFDTINSNCSNDGIWWGGTYYVSNKGTGSNQDINMYGFIKSGYYSPDSYSDTLRATISF